MFSMENMILVLYGSWEALVVCKILLQGVGTISKFLHQTHLIPRTPFVVHNAPGTATLGLNGQVGVEECGLPPTPP